MDGDDDNHDGSLKPEDGSGGAEGAVSGPEAAAAEMTSRDDGGDVDVPGGPEDGAVAALLR